MQYFNINFILNNSYLTREIFMQYNKNNSIFLLYNKMNNQTN